MKKIVVITAGGTSERVDDVRTINNMSTGKLGSVICNKILDETYEDVKVIYYICSKNSIKPREDKKVNIIYVKSTNDLKEKVENLITSTKVDVFIHSMAVSDYMTEYVSSIQDLSCQVAEKVFDVRKDINKEEITKLVMDVFNNPEHKISTDSKISSSEDGMFIKLKKTPKVISVIKELDPKIKLIGFKLLSNVSEEELVLVATKLMVKNNCDYVVANDLASIREGRHTAIIIDKDNNKEYVNSKEEIA